MLSEPAGFENLTNGLILIPTDGPIGQITTSGILGKRQLPYEAYFQIFVDSTSPNQTSVTVRTIIANAFDGIAFTHGGFGRRAVRVSPLIQEEENVLSEIARHVDSRFINHDGITH